MFYKSINMAFLVSMLYFMSLNLLLNGQDSEASKVNSINLIKAGINLSADEAKQLEDRLELDPNSMGLRAQLLGYYFDKMDGSARKARVSHVLWFIRNAPGESLSGLPYCWLNPILDGEVYYRAKNLWLHQVQTYKDHPIVLGHAASFFSVYERNLAEDLLKRASDIDPNNTQWSLQLGYLYSLSLNDASVTTRREAAQKTLFHLEKLVDGRIEKTERASVVIMLARAAYEAGHLEKARNYAQELLSISQTHSSHGDAVHHGNLILGSLALKLGSVEKAKGHLIAAGKTPGSNVLNSFGPRMSLAKELLEKGERDVVIEYLSLCAVFWKSGKAVLDNWLATVKGGGVPSFESRIGY